MVLDFEVVAEDVEDTPVLVEVLDLEIVLDMLPDALVVDLETLEEVED